MEQLITIETVPIKIEYVEKESLALSSVHAFDGKADHNKAEQPAHVQPIRINLQDSFVPSSSYNWDNSTYTATAKIGDDGNLKLNIQMEDGDSRAIRFTQANRSINSMARKMKSELNPEYANMELSIPLAALPSGMPTVDNFNSEFMPPDLELVVTQRADVVIKYVGGPIYVPPSADPNYKPPLGFEQQRNMSAAPLLDEKV
ncbi:hypothetical protein [Acetobacterium wieringae]|uniref:hypothetical protein n=1 Tax=Acetobacterium wieringae TaxID=52694 RepID=UPI002034758F|nr:hypothetical protein [Acetobacterium wieringae]URN85401.1 hypothetical protein CHL1_001042 [Acetobacterium wieringae]